VGRRLRHRHDRHPRVEPVGPGSGWRYELVPAAEGTDLCVSLTRLPNSFKGKLIATLIPIAGPRALGKQFQSVLRRAETR
ncbi:MAG TPA: hypothetical protein VES02_08235, partial [Dermatophilaceae bacterium]|nr:hypothetical protein [Dermatophilaceae bacterium]